MGLGLTSGARTQSGRPGRARRREGLGTESAPGTAARPRAGPRGVLTGLHGRCPQRHFCVFAVSFPGQEALTTIYSTILSQHLAYRSAPMVVQKMSGQLVASALGKPASLLPPPVSKTCCSLEPTAPSSFPPVNILFMLFNRYFLNDAVFPQEM